MSIANQNRMSGTGMGSKLAPDWWPYTETREKCNMLCMKSPPLAQTLSFMECDLWMKSTSCICIRCRDVTFSGYIHLQNVSEDKSKLPLKWLLGCCYLDVKFETNLKGWMDKYKMYTYEDTVYSIVRRKRWYHCHSNGHLTPECDVQTGFFWPKATSMECSNSPTGRYSPIAWTGWI
jgi:hypothetical protein